MCFKARTAFGSTEWFTDMTACYHSCFRLTVIKYEKTFEFSHFNGNLSEIFLLWKVHSFLTEVIFTAFFFQTGLFYTNTRRYLACQHDGNLVSAIILLYILCHTYLSMSNMEQLNKTHGCAQLNVTILITYH